MSVFTLVAITGPRQPRMAGTTSALVLPDWVGPNTTTDWARSAATRWRPDRPRTMRPGLDAAIGSSAGTNSGRRSRRRAHRAERAQPPPAMPWPVQRPDGRCELDGTRRPGGGRG